MFMPLQTAEGSFRAEDNDGKCALFSRKLGGKPGQGQRSSTVQEQKTYAVVSCLLKFESRNFGRKVTIFSDNKNHGTKTIFVL